VLVTYEIWLCVYVSMHNQALEEDLF
jgi:hypothetical protein